MKIVFPKVGFASEVFFKIWIKWKTSPKNIFVLIFFGLLLYLIKLKVTMIIFQFIDCRLVVFLNHRHSLGFSYNFILYFLWVEWCCLCFNGHYFDIKIFHQAWTSIIELACPLGKSFININDIGILVSRLSSTFLLDLIGCWFWHKVWHNHMVFSELPFSH
jgi:hypothetical protein